MLYLKIINYKSDAGDDHVELINKTCLSFMTQRHQCIEHE